MQLLHGGNKLADRRCPDRDVSHHNPRHKPHKETADCNNKKVRKAGQVGERP